MFCMFTSFLLMNVLQILGLDICADTLVGDPIRRGISGGQKKRLTTGSVDFDLTVNKFSYQCNNICMHFRFLESNQI